MKVGDLVRLRKHPEWVEVFGEDTFRPPGVVIRIWKQQDSMVMQAEVLLSSGIKCSLSVDLLEVINDD